MIWKYYRTFQHPAVPEPCYVLMFLIWGVGASDAESQGPYSILSAHACPQRRAAVFLVSKAWQKPLPLNNSPSSSFLSWLILLLSFVWNFIQFLILSSFLKLKSRIASLFSTFALLSLSWIYSSLGSCHKGLTCFYLFVYLFMSTHMIFHVQYHKTVLQQGRD